MAQVIVVIRLTFGVRAKKTEIISISSKKLVFNKLITKVDRNMLQALHLHERPFSI